MRALLTDITVRSLKLEPGSDAIHITGKFFQSYTVDGYLRYRGRDEQSAPETNGYIAVLTEDRRVACEWPTLGQIELPSHIRPALCEAFQTPVVPASRAISSASRRMRFARL